MDGDAEPKIGQLEVRTQLLFDGRQRISSSQGIALHQADFEFGNGMGLGHVEEGAGHQALEFQRVRVERLEEQLVVAQILHQVAELGGRKFRQWTQRNQFDELVVDMRLIKTVERRVVQPHLEGVGILEDKRLTVLAMEDQVESVGQDLLVESVRPQGVAHFDLRMVEDAQGGGRLEKRRVIEGKGQA